MLGKGAKRKFSEHEDGVEGKMSGGSGPSKVSYTLQRQTIFNISLMKLYNHQPLLEPSLQRTVLINNMLRRIQEELKQEGSLRPMFIAPSQPSDTLNYREVQPAFNHLPVPPIQLTSLASTTSPDSCLTPASVLEEDNFSGCQIVDLGVSKPQNHSQKDSFSSALDEIEELGPPPATAETKSCKGASSEGGSDDPTKLQQGRPSEGKFADTLPGNFEITTTGFLTDLTLDDILFADIDTSMYDFDPCTSTGSSSKITAVTADDILKTFSPYSNQSVSPNQPFKMDLAELDHIMEVLVGS